VGAVDVVVCEVTGGGEGPVSPKQTMAAALWNFHEEKWTPQHLYSLLLKHTEVQRRKSRPSKLSWKHEGKPSYSATAVTDVFTLATVGRAQYCYLKSLKRWLVPAMSTAAPKLSIIQVLIQREIHLLSHHLVPVPTRACRVFKGM